MTGATFIDALAGARGCSPEGVVLVVRARERGSEAVTRLEEHAVGLLRPQGDQVVHLPQVIGKGEPACLVCHWPGIYYNGARIGFRIFQEVVRRLHARYDNLLWMKNSEISRYWAARELTTIDKQGAAVRLRAPFASPAFTLDVKHAGARAASLRVKTQARPLREVAKRLDLQSGAFFRHAEGVIACFDLPKGDSVLELI